MTVEVRFQGSKDSLNNREDGGVRRITPGKGIDLLIDASERLVVSCDNDDNGGWVGMQSGFKISGEKLEPSQARLERGSTLYVERSGEVIARVTHKIKSSYL